MPTIVNGIKIGTHMTDEDRKKLRDAVGGSVFKETEKQEVPKELEEPLVEEEKEGVDEDA